MFASLRVSLRNSSKLFLNLGDYELWLRLLKVVPELNARCCWLPNVHNVIAGCQWSCFDMINTSVFFFQPHMKCVLCRVLDVLLPFLFNHRLRYSVFYWCCFFFILGIQSYVIEGRLSCSVDWDSDLESAFVYNIVIFTTSFSIPILLIVTVHVQILCMVSVYM